jgi:hypothetical protein
MSPENVELVRQGFADEFDRRFDDANLDEFFDPIEWGAGPAVATRQQ